MNDIPQKIAWIKEHRARYGSSLATAKNRVEAGWRPGDPDAGGERAPIPMILFCPDCGLQHIDEADFVPDPGGGDLGVAMDVAGQRATAWTNPPHRSHLCAGCGHIWRPADVPTIGVANIETRGKADHLPARRDYAGRCTTGCDGPAPGWDEP